MTLQKRFAQFFYGFDFFGYFSVRKSEKKRQKSEKIRNFDFSGQERGQNSKYRETSNHVFEELYKDVLYKSTGDFDKNCGFLYHFGDLKIKLVFKV